MTATGKKTDNSKSWQGHGETGTLIHCWWECKLVRLHWKTVWRFLKRLNIELLCDPAILLLGRHPRETKTSPFENMYMSAHDSIIHNSQSGNNPNYEQRAKKLQACSEILHGNKKDEVLTPATTWMNFQKPLC